MSLKVKVKVQFLGPLSEAAGKRQVVLEVEPDVRAAIADIEGIFRLKSPDGQLAPGGVFVNGRHVSLLPKEKMLLKDNDIITFMHCVSGG
ncbi:MAG: MoaD/ThiS family protein [Negativicutes bacterium]|nr:MoaD/ThiS family protein [Negativicutes bacterium]